MSSTRISIENVRDKWVAEVELPRAAGGIIRRKVAASTREDCFKQIDDLFTLAQSEGPREDPRIGEQAIALKADILARRKEGESIDYLPMAREDFDAFIKHGAGLDIWERRTPGKPLAFEGAIFALPVKTEEGEKHSWRLVTEEDVKNPPVESSDDADAEGDEEEDEDPAAPVHTGKPTKAGFWKGCRCPDCERKRDEANNRKAETPPAAAA